MTLSHGLRSLIFLSTPSRWRATAEPQTQKVVLKEFLSTPSGWRATGHATVNGDRVDDFYPRPPGGGRPAQTFRRGSFAKISIHALRVEGDEYRYIFSAIMSRFLSTPSGWRATRHAADRAAGGRISIHALRVEGDLRIDRPKLEDRRFLSTPSGWRATIRAQCHRQDDHYFYPRPPGGGRRAKTLPFSRDVAISIHALRVEGDPERCMRPSRQPKFLSTPSGWRATPRNTRRLPSANKFLSTPSGWRATVKTDKVFVCFCAKGRRLCLFKTRKEKNLPVAF